MPLDQIIRLALLLIFSVNAALVASAVSLEGLVVVGYTTQERRDISGAVAAVDDSELEARKVATLEEALKGRVPGVNIKTSGEPGQAAAITVRGQNFLYNSSPLYVVDGLYMTQNPNLNPNDISSIQVLKDASAASQYGAQAANGVVVITTKRGQAAGRNGLQISSYDGLQEMPNRIDVMNAREWAAFAKMAYENARAQNPNSDPVPQGVEDILDGTLAVDTDWQDVILDEGAIQDHNLSMSGATEDADYFLSGGYTRQDGTVRKTDFERFSLRVVKTDRLEGVFQVEHLVRRFGNAFRVRVFVQHDGHLHPLAPHLGTILAGALDLRLVRVDLVLDEAAHRRDDHLLLFGQSETHRRLPGLDGRSLRGAAGAPQLFAAGGITR